MKRSFSVTFSAVALGVVLFVGGALVSRPGSLADPVRSPADRVGPDVRIATQDLDSVIAALKERIASEQPTLAADQASLAFAYLQKARVEADPALYDAAEESLLASFRSQPNENLEATLASAVLAGSRHDFRGQLRWGRRAVQIDPSNTQALGTVGDAYLELGATRKGFRLYQRMVNLRPDLSSMGRISYAAELQGDTDGAIKAMQRALGFAGSSRDNAAWAHWQLGELYIGAQRFDLAAKHLDAALVLVPGFGSAMESKAHLAAARGNIAEAIDILSALVEDFPLPGNFAFLGELYLIDGRGSQAREAFEEADRRLDLYSAHGVLPDVDFVTFWADRGIHLKRSLRAARTLYKQRTSAAVSDGLAWALYANGRVQEAKPFAREAMRRGPGDAGYHYHSALISRALGDDAAAGLLLKKALRLDPSWSIIESHTARRIVAGESVHAPALNALPAARSARMDR